MIISLKDYRARKQILDFLKDLDALMDNWRDRDDKHMIYPELQKIKWLQMELHDKMRRIGVK